MEKNTSGSYNVALGNYAAYYGEDGSNNTALGAYTLLVNVSGQRNTAVGYDALRNTLGNQSNGEGENNTAIGQAAGLNNITGYDNVFVGKSAGQTCSSGYHNTMVGKWCGFYVDSGYHNTLIGYGAGLSISSGYNNLCLGRDAGTGNSPSGNLTSNNGIVCLGDNSISNIYCADTSISSSDARDKTDVNDFDHGLDWIKLLRPVTYRWDKRSWYNEYDDQGNLKKEVTPDGSKKRDRVHLGFLAQEAIDVEKQFGYADTKDNMLIVNQDENDAAPSYGMKYERLVPVLVNAVKELSAEVDTLKEKISQLEAG